MLRSTSAVAIVLALGLLGGCGGDGRDEETSAYISAVRGAQTQFATSIERIQRGAAGSAVTAGTVDRLGGAVDRMAEDLRRIDAPARVDRLHARLVNEVDGFHGALRRAERAFRSRDRETILAQRSRLVSSATAATRDIEATLASIDRELGS